MIVGRCSMAKWPKPPQKIKFLLTEPGNVDERLCPAEHCQQTQQQNLIQRIDHLAGLTRVRQILEKVQKNSCFADRAKVDRRVFHRPSSKNESEDHDRFSISALCHVFLHPIALKELIKAMGGKGNIVHLAGLLVDPNTTLRENAVEKAIAETNGAVKL